MLHICPDSAVIRLKKAGYGSRLTVLQTAGQCKYQVFIFPHQLPGTHMLLPYVENLAVGLHTCTLLLTSITYLCKPKSDKLSSLKTTSNNFFSTFSSILVTTFLLFLPHTKQSTRFSLVSFPHQSVFIHRQEKGTNTKGLGRANP